MADKIVINTGPLGLLSRAKTLGIVPRLGPLVAKLQSVGLYVDTELIRRVLAGVDE
jgi:predicted nucleic acid-binding protein